MLLLLLLVVRENNPRMMDLCISRWAKWDGKEIRGGKGSMRDLDNSLLDSVHSAAIGFFLLEMEYHPFTTFCNV